MIPTIPNTVVLPLSLVLQDRHIREEFLSDSLERICEVAGQSGSAILISTAGQNLKVRETAFAVWRSLHLAKIATVCPEIGEFLSDSASDTAALSSTDADGTGAPASSRAAWAAAYADGTVDLVELDAAIYEQRAEKARQRLELLSSQKAAIRAALDANCVGMPLGGFPGVVVIRSDGEMKLLKNQNSGKAWGYAGGGGFSLIPLDMVAMRRFLPLE